MSDEILSLHAYERLFPNASEAAKRRNTFAWAKQLSETERSVVSQEVCEGEGAVCAPAGAVAPGCKKVSPKLEQDSGTQLLGSLSGAGCDSKKHLVRYEIRRNRLIHDGENICTKAFTDALRYAGLIPNDKLDSLKIEFSQTQVPKAEECTIIDIFPPGTWPK